MENREKFGNRVLVGEMVEMLHKPGFRVGEGFWGQEIGNMLGTIILGGRKWWKMWSY